MQFETIDYAKQVDQTKDFKQFMVIFLMIKTH